MSPVRALAVALALTVVGAWLGRMPEPDTGEAQPLPRPRLAELPVPPAEPHDVRVADAPVAARRREPHER